MIYKILDQQKVINMATSVQKNKKIVNAIEEDLEQLSSYDGDVAKRFISFIIK